MIGRMIGLRAIPLSLFVVLTACSSAEAPVPPAPPPPAWHVAGGALRDPEGRTAVLRGFNLAGSHKYKPYFGFHQAADYARVRKDWGMGSVRFVITWAAIEPEKGMIDTAYLDELEKRIGWAEDAGLAVVLDMHQDLYGEGFEKGGGDGAPKWTCDQKYYDAFKPTDPWALAYFDPNVQHCIDALYMDSDLQEHFIGAWTKVAERLVHRPNVVGFDVLNEPGWGTSSLVHYEHDVLEPLYEKVVPRVRAVAPAWVAFLEPGGSRNAGVPTSLVPFSFDNVVYAPHSYDINAEGMTGFNPMDRDGVIMNIQSLADDARMLGTGLWIGEYGGIVSLPGIVEYMTADYDGAGAIGAGTEYWSYDEADGFGFLTPDGKEKADLIKTVVRPFPERVAGELHSYAFDAATNALSVVMTPDAAITAPTVISVPPRLAPNGVTVDCGGCTVTPSGGLIALSKLAAGKQTITVRPH